MTSESFGHIYTINDSPDDVHAMLLTRLDSTPTTSSVSRSTSRAGRGTLSALSGLPLEISALIRSHSASRRHHSNSDTEMYSDDDRPSRKSKFENKIYNFLTRSRSRSRSKNSRVLSVEPVPDLPEIPRTPMTSPSKPSSRIPSRPLSSTTTATNTTVIPGTPRPKKPPSGIPVPVEPTPDTQKHSGTRKTLHNLFGIPLSSPKKSSFSSSRRDSPRTSSDSAPGHDDLYEDTPKAPKSFSPHPNSRPDSPTPPSRRPANDSVSSTATSSTSTSSRLHKFFTGRKTPPRIAPSPETVSGPRRPSLSSHHRHSSTESNSRTSDPMSSHTKTTGNMAPPPLPPKILHTPATPQATTPFSSVTHEQNLSHRMRSLDSGYRHRMGERMAVVDETGVVRGNGKGKERELGNENGTAMGNSISRMKSNHGRGTAGRSTKHGSFDFERPGWSTAGVIQRSGSGGTTGSGETGASGWSKNANGFLGGIRESAMGPGLAGVGTLQRDQSLKRAKEREEMIMRAREDDRKRREKEKGMKEKQQQQHRSLLRATPLPDTDENGVRTSTSTTGKSSSLGKKPGGLLRDGSFKGKRSAFGVTHGRFAFEPPVSPKRSNGTNGGVDVDAQLSVSWNGGTELQKENTRLKGEMEREREKARKNHLQRDRAPVPVPSVGHRSAAKGRSLDLGLGLAWAPTKLKEEALLPASGFFARSVSSSSSQGVHRSVSGSTTTSGDGRAGSKVGRKIADVFKNALSDEGYVAFKKYVHQFDAHGIPFDGPNGIVARVERLLKTAPDLSEEGKKQLLDSFVRIVLENA